MRKRNYKYSIIILISSLLAACSYEPETFMLGTDVCEHCKMTIVDSKWGSELITQKGKIYKFDVIECMILFKNESIKEEDIHSMWTINYLEPSNFLNVEDAIYIRDNSFNSPMGLNAISLEKEKEIEKLNLNNKPEIIKWQQLIKLVHSEFY